MDNLISFGSLTSSMADFLQACVVSRMNIIVSGGTGSGKTTLINCLSGYIPEGERTVTIEDAAELQFKQRNVVRLETKKPTPDSPGIITVRDCVVNALRMRPERIVVGECRSGETLDMLQAMNTGHDGSMTTVHANSPRDCISRLETLVLMAGVDLPLQVVRTQIAKAINLIVQVNRLRDGSRKITFITEVQGIEGDTPVLTDIFKFVEKGEEEGKVTGEHEPAGLRPKCEPTLRNHGFNLPATMFMKASSFK
jgi:pilus assembly protein CpaF